MPNSSLLNLPPEWSLSQLVLVHQGQVTERGSPPFAGNVVVTVRLDIDAKADLALALARDVDQLRSALPRASVLDEGSMQGGLAHGELTFDDLEGRRVQQLLLCFRSRGSAYSLIGTHLAGTLFEHVRATMMDIARRLMGPT
jgi:hypothetical protein